jgi:Leucine-rich repeat (LRR) protein
LNFLGLKIRDLSPISGMPLADLDIGGNDITDWSLFAGMPLKKLACKDNLRAAAVRNIKTLEKINGQPVAEFLKQAPILPPDTSSNTPTLQHSNLSPAPLSAFCAEVAALPAEQQVARVVAKLKELNLEFDAVKAKVAHKIEKGAVTELSFYAIGVTNIVPVAALTSLVKLACSGSTSERSPLEDLSPLRDLPLKVLDCSRNGVADLSPLRGMLLSSFNCSYGGVTDLSPLRGMPLEYVGFYARPIEDLAPLADSPLVEIYCSPPLASRPENVKVLKSIPTLKTINGLPAAEFWKKVEAGEVPKVK